MLKRLNFLDRLAVRRVSNRSILTRGCEKAPISSRYFPWGAMEVIDKRRLAYKPLSTCCYPRAVKKEFDVADFLDRSPVVCLPRHERVTEALREGLAILNIVNYQQTFLKLMITSNGSKLEPELLILMITNNPSNTYESLRNLHERSITTTELFREDRSSSLRLISLSSARLCR